MFFHMGAVRDTFSFSGVLTKTTFRGSEMPQSGTAVQALPVQAGATAKTGWQHAAISLIHCFCGLVCNFRCLGCVIHVWACRSGLCTRGSSSPNQVRCRPRLHAWLPCRRPKARLVLTSNLPTGLVRVRWLAGYQLRTVSSCLIGIRARQRLAFACILPFPLLPVLSACCFELVEKVGQRSMSHS